MKITIYSSTFLPNIGGLENIMSGLAEEWSDMGHSVNVFTETPGKSLQSENRYRIFRSPSLLQLYQSAKNADIYVEANMSLKTVLVGLMLRKKWVLIHHLPYTHGGKITGYIKQWLTRFSNNVAVSRYVQETISGNVDVIPNFYNPVFDIQNTQPRKAHTVFVGRLVSDKGLDLLFRAIDLVRADFPDLHLSVFGDGPDREKLVQLAQELKITHLVSFNYSLSPDLLAQQLANFRWMVIPSLWEEPFGLVALEGLAAGCSVIASDGGGLPEAVGNFGLLFKRGDVHDLAEQLRKAYSTPFHQDMVALKEHLAAHNRRFVAQKYFQYFRSLQHS